MGRASNRKWAKRIKRYLFGTTEQKILWRWIYRNKKKWVIE